MEIRTISSFLDYFEKIRVPRQALRLFQPDHALATHPG